MRILSPRLLLAALPIFVLAGCGGSGGDDDEDNDIVPAGIVRFSGESGDLNADDTDLDSTSGYAIPTATTLNVGLDGGNRSLNIAIPNDHLDAGAITRYDGTVGNAVAGFRFASLSPSLSERLWDATGGSVTVLSRDLGVTRLRLNNLRFTPSSTASEAVGSFTLNGTITANDVQTLNGR